MEEKKALIVKDLFLNLAELGKIKIGGLGEERTARSGKAYKLPQKLDHFVITKNVRDSGGRLIIDTTIMDKLDADPKSIAVTLLYDDPRKNLVSFYALYSGGYRVCWGDGETAQRRGYKDRKNDKGETIREYSDDWKKITCPLRECPEWKANRCKMHGILSVVLRESPVVGGVYRFRTTSRNSIQYLYSSMAFLGKIAYNVLAGLPLRLVIQPETREAKGHGRVLIQTVNLLYDGSMEDLRNKALEVAQTRATVHIEMKQIESQIKALPDESNAEQYAIEQEYHPESREIVPQFQNGKVEEAKIEKEPVKKESEKQEPKEPEKPKASEKPESSTKPKEEKKEEKNKPVKDQIDWDKPKLKSKKEAEKPVNEEPKPLFP